MRGKQGAGANRFGQQQHITGLHAALAHHAVHLLVDQPVDGKAQGQLGTFARVPAYQGAACGVQHLDRATHHLGQQVFDLALQTRRHGDHGGGGLGFAPHGKDVAQRVVGGHFAKHIRVVDEGPEKIHRLHHGHARRHTHHSRVVWRMQADQHVRTLYRLQLPQGAGQNAGADFGTTPPAAHRNGRDGLQRLFGSQVQLGGVPLALGLNVFEQLPHGLHGFAHLCPCLGGAACSGHGRELGEAAHELAVDAVLPAPDPCPSKAQ